MEGKECPFVFIEFNANYCDSDSTYQSHGNLTDKLSVKTRTEWDNGRHNIAGSKSERNSVDKMECFPVLRSQHFPGLVPPKSAQDDVANDFNNYECC